MLHRNSFFAHPENREFVSLGELGVGGGGIGQPEISPNKGSQSEYFGYFHIYLALMMKIIMNKKITFVTNYLNL